MSAGQVTTLFFAAIGMVSVPVVPLLLLRVRYLERRVDSDPFRSDGARGPAFPTIPLDSTLGALDDLAYEGYWLSPDETVNLTATVRQLRDEVDALRVECFVHDMRRSA